MLDFRRLRLLTLFASLGTVTAVARTARLTPSAVSQQLARLEREVGMTLLQRSGRQLALTEAGRLLVDHAERIFAEVERTETALSQLRHGGVGQLRLATLPSISRRVVPRALARFAEAGLPVEIGLREVEAHESLPALQRGEIELALVDQYDPLPALTIPGIDLVALFSELMYLVVPAGSSLARPQLELADCADQRWITCQQGTFCHTAIMSVCAAAGFHPDIAHTSNDFAVIQAMVEAGLGISLVPQVAIALTRYDIQCVAPAGPPIRRRLSAAVRSASRHRPALRRLVEAFTAVAAELHPHPEPAFSGVIRAEELSRRVEEGQQATAFTGSTKLVGVGTLCSCR
ncbi:LysR family transcriptional regulator [Natronosporangium hydrolyticum]|uniref:LysR family transcriptional regulator n=1 Tax=Natronosporangium hydrolyticum TaxID=2811111 RepID=A0A895YQ49_9ACTN|nr:LysR family transcriptional regulator [Natronosporangium hydrolyticum]QSB16866.1 LysR family transcriptional regulator [Natronosporangium hydrolyticum]